MRNNKLYPYRYFLYLHDIQHIFVQTQNIMHYDKEVKYKMDEEGHLG